MTYIWLAACVFGIAVGQVLLKLTADRTVDRLANLLFAPTLWMAVVIYALASIAWLMALRGLDLSRAYPFVAGSFILVPMLSAQFLNETVPALYWIGVAFIVIGVALATRA